MVQASDIHKLGNVVKLGNVGKGVNVGSAPTAPTAPTFPTLRGFLTCARIARVRARPPQRSCERCRCRVKAVQRSERLTSYYRLALN